MQTTTRPSTSKSRGQCRYHTSSPRGCLAGDSCKFLHGDETISPYDRAKACKFYAAGYCKRGEDCWFRHIPPDTKSLPTAELPPLASGDPCGICLEVPVTFGLLSDCGHAFCLDCIRNWREQKTKNDDYAESRMNKRCPYCRTLSGYVFPSSHFYPHGHPGKDAALRRYKESAARVPCKYFNESPPEDRYCPFGHDCHYQHLDADGTPYIFPRGVSHYMSQLNLRRRPQDRATPITIPQAPVDFTHRDDLRNFFNDVRHILDSIRPTATAPAPALGGDLPPTAAEHLLDVLNATELAVAELWATESSRAPSPEPATPPPPLVPSLGPAPEDEELDDASMVPLLANAGGLGIDSDSDIESDFPSVSTLLARLPPRSTLHEATFPSAATTSANIPPTQQSLNTPLVAPEPPLPTTEATATLSSDAGIPATVPISPQDQAGVDVPAGVEERPTAHAEPPFMTDGRGRVVWSRSGAKEGVPSAEGQPSASS